MKIINVESSNLKSVGYDDSDSVLFIEFKHGGTYKYFNIPKNIYDGLLKADSKGGYLDRYVKKAGYKYFKV